NSELKGLLTRQQGLHQEIEDLSGQREELESYLSAVCRKLDIEESAAPKGIYEYYRTIFDIQQRIINLDEEEAKFKDQSAQLAGQLREIDRLILEFEKISADCDDLHDIKDRDVLQPEVWQDIQTRIKNWYSLM